LLLLLLRRRLLLRQRLLPLDLSGQQIALLLDRPGHHRPLDGLHEGTCACNDSVSATSHGTETAARVTPFGQQQQTHVRLHVLTVLRFLRSLDVSAASGWYASSSPSNSSVDTAHGAGIRRVHHIPHYPCQQHTATKARLLAGTWLLSRVLMKSVTC
jgi:hypothetical protein